MCSGSTNMHNVFMLKALFYAKKALMKNEVPIGVVIVENNQIVAYGHNRCEKTNNPLLHAEIIAVKQYMRKFHHAKMHNCRIYITMEPCLMCLGFLLECHIKQIFFGANNLHYTTSSMVNILKQTERFKNIEYVGGIMANETQQIIKTFFKVLRINNAR